MVRMLEPLENKVTFQATTNAFWTCPRCDVIYGIFGPLALRSMFGQDGSCSHWYERKEDLPEF